MQRTANARRHSLGFTLIELCTGLGICAALLGQAVPAMSQLHQQQRLRVANQELAFDLRLARAEATRLNESVFFRVSGRGSQACYVMYTGIKDDCDCTVKGQASCKSATAQVIKSTWFSTQQPVVIQSNVETFQFQSQQGLVTQTGSIDLSLNGSSSVRQVVAITGRARTCFVNTPLFGLLKCK